MKKVNSNKSKKSVIFCPQSEMNSVIAALLPDELQKQASQFNLEQLDRALSALKDVSEVNWPVKLEAVFKGIEEVEALEFLGSNLNLAQFLHLVDFAPSDPKQAWKLVPILVALPHSLFSQMLTELPEERKQQLKYLCATEPLRHHLVLFGHEIKKFFEQSEADFLQLEHEIKQLNVKDLKPQELLALQSSLENFRHAINETGSKIENALALAWNGNSREIVEVLSAYKERNERLSFSLVGQPGKTLFQSQGLYLLLETQLAAAFEKGINRQSFEALNDDDQAIDALAFFSIWYPQDYWKLGLLPKISDPTHLAPQLTCNPTLLSQYRVEAEKNLSILGLNTVKDLKERHLVSSALLSEYLALHAQKFQ